jgi:hypothetical protein
MRLGRNNPVFRLWVVPKLFPSCSQVVPKSFPSQNHRHLADAGKHRGELWHKCHQIWLQSNSITYILQMQVKIVVKYSRFRTQGLFRTFEDFEFRAAFTDRKNTPTFAAVTVKKVKLSFS